MLTIQPKSRHEIQNIISIAVSIHGANESLDSSSHHLVRNRGIVWADDYTSIKPHLPPNSGKVSDAEDF
jgi:hypothetical protein